MLRGLLDLTSDGLLAIDDRGVIVATNAPAARIVGRDRRALVGKPLAALVALPDRRALRRALNGLPPAGASLELHLLGSGDPWTVDVRPLRRVTPRTFAVSLQHDGEPPAAVPGSPPFERLVLRFPYAAVAFRRDGRVAVANAHARHVLGRDSVRSGAQLGALLPPALRALARRLIAVPAPLHATHVELEDGRVLRVTGIAATADEPAVMFLEDATDEHRRERVMREFLRNAAHQLRTPLAGIVASVETLQGGAKERPADRDRFLDHVEKHAARLTRIARGLLVLARAQTGEQLRVDLVQIAPLLDRLARSAEPRPDVALHVDCEPGLAALAEPDLLQEALAALLDNAVAHTFDGEVVLAARCRGDAVELSVVDSGRGILPEFRDRVFEPFFRTVDDGDGFGLGLAIAAQAVAAMGGTLDVSARPGGGSAFTIRLRALR